jgi:hypothetical protein
MSASRRPHPHLPHLATRVAAGGGGAVARPCAAAGALCFLLGALRLLPDASPRSVESDRR